MVSGALEMLLSDCLPKLNRRNFENDSVLELAINQLLQFLTENDTNARFIDTIRAIVWQVSRAKKAEPEEKKSGQI
jgi:hypothetical protein